MKFDKTNTEKLIPYMSLSNNYEKVFTVLAFFHVLLEMGFCDSNDFKSRVIEGYEATSGQFPWAVLISCNDTKVGIHCSGSLISENFVLTAAHCFSGKIACTVALGGRKKQSPEVWRFRTKFYSHSCYSDDISRKRYDIGLIELEKKVEMVNGTRAIGLPNKTFTIDTASQFTAVGWGSMEANKASDVLRYATMKQMSQKTCTEIFFLFEDPYSLCAKSVEPKMQLCSEDSGGPLVYGSGESATQVAINIFYQREEEICASSDLPQGFLRVAPLLD